MARLGLDAGYGIEVIWHLGRVSGGSSDRLTLFDIKGLLDLDGLRGGMW